MTERYVTARELAELMGVSVRTIQRLTTPGMPSENWGMSRTRRYLPSQAMTWASAGGTMRERKHRSTDAPTSPRARPIRGD